ncbi:hypothetical protein MKX01_012069 [Papaver californicum]|nr:hypothetical protein MKX01_012069 [Papaver californicum]
MNGEKNGFVNFFSTLIEKAPVMMEEKKKLGSVDEVTKTITYSVTGGDLLKLYKVIDDKVEENDETIEGGTVKWSVKYEKVNEMVKEPNMGGGIVKWSVMYEKVNEMVPEPNMVKDMIY